jgi:DNA-binding NtrC family response regulator
LRERQTDIEKLALHFLAHLGAEMGHSRAYFAPETIRLFQLYSWPGNVRELRNVVERALVLSRGDLILPRHLPRELRDLEQMKPTISFAMHPHPKADDTHTTKTPESRTEGAVESHVHTPPVLHVASVPHPKDLTSQTPEYARSLAFLSEAPRLLAQEEASSTLRLEHVIVQHIQHVLEACEGNVTRAAEILGITRQTLRRRLREIASVEDG